MIDQQEITDWKNHPITINFNNGVNQALEYYDKKLANLDMDFDPKEVARIIGVKQGLEALLTYNPEIDPETGEFI